MREDMKHGSTAGEHGSTAGELARLDDLEDYKVADGDPDVRGWDVKTDDDRKVGKVDSLIVDTAVMKVRYIGVELDKRELKLDEDRRVLIPIGDARLDDHNDNILVGRKTVMQVSTLLAYRPGEPITTGQTPPPRDTDAKQFYGKRGGAGDIQRMTLSEEELNIGKRQKNSGEAEVRRTVETEHESRKVPLMHEEVTMERRPVSPDTADPDGIEEGEIRIPLMAEEAVVDKRAVAKEEVVIKKQQVQGEQTVEADLKREAIDVEQGGKHTSDRSRPSADQKGKGQGDRMADKADDMKDRFDANPASRPGRDATDRPAR